MGKQITTYGVQNTLMEITARNLDERTTNSVWGMRWGRGVEGGHGQRVQGSNSCILERGVRVYHARKKEVFLAEISK